MKSRLHSRDIFAYSHILIIDDFEPDRELLRHICNKVGFVNIEAASSGREGLEKAALQKPDLILLDMEMPGMNGIEFCIKLQELYNDVCVIMQTALDRPEDKARAFDAGITDFISKPVNSIEFAARALSHLEKRAYQKRLETDYQRIKDELAEAITLQRVLLPSDETLEQIQNKNGLDIAYYYQPSSEMGGDYLTVSTMSGAKTMLVMVDISGHGVTAALYAFVLHTLLKDEDFHTMLPGQILGELNSKLHTLMPRGKFATMFLGIVDTEHSMLDYAASASPRPILFFSNGTAELLDTRGFLLGTKVDADYPTHRVAFNKGDTLFLYSDTFTETVDSYGQYLTEEEIIPMLKPHLACKAGTMVKRALSSFLTRCANNPTDDLSIMICKR